MSDLNFRKLLLLTVLETFSPLKTPEEKRRFEELMETPEHRRTREFRQTWIDQLTMVGLLEARRSTLLRQSAPSSALRSMISCGRFAA